MVIKLYEWPKYNRCEVPVPDWRKSPRLNERTTGAHKLFVQPWCHSNQSQYPKQGGTLDEPTSGCTVHLYMPLSFSEVVAAVHVPLNQFTEPGETSTAQQKHPCAPLYVGAAATCNLLSNNECHCFTCCMAERQILNSGSHITNNWPANCLHSLNGANYFSTLQKLDRTAPHRTAPRKDGEGPVHATNGYTQMSYLRTDRLGRLKAWTVQSTFRTEFFAETATL